MKLYRFDSSVGRSITQYDSRNLIVNPIVRTAEESTQIASMTLQPGGVIGYHQAVLPQLFLVIAGAGWVRGEEETRTPIQRGQAAFWQAGEGHESGTDTGLIALVIESPTLDPDAFLTPFPSFDNVRRVEVLPYDPQWQERYTEEARRIVGILGEEAVGCYHIGSTSVPDLSAKPIIDILVEVRDIERIDAFNAQMEQLGYVCKGENGIPERRYFQKGGNERTHHVHMFRAGHPEVRRHLAFRDYMRAHPEAARAYGELKEQLAKKYPTDIEQYIVGKHGFVQEMDERARRWKEETLR